MKLTRKQLRKLITETMITPSTDIIRKVLDDPEVDERLKVLLGSNDDESIAQALDLLIALYPDKYGHLEYLHPNTGTSEYEDDFKFKTIQQNFKADPAVVRKRFWDWLSKQVKNPSPAMINHFKAAIAVFFKDAYAFGEYYHFDRSHSGGSFIDEVVAVPSHEVDPLNTLIVDEYLNINSSYDFWNRYTPAVSTSNTHRLYDHLYTAIKSPRNAIADVRDGLLLAHEELVREGEMHYVEDAVQIRGDVFTDPVKWLNDNGYSELI